MAKEIVKKLFNGVRVYTMQDFAVMNCVSSGTARMCFKDNENLLVDGKDYFKPTRDQVKGVEPYIVDKIDSEYAFDIGNGKVQIRKGENKNIHVGKWGFVVLLTLNGVYSLRKIIKQHNQHITLGTNYLKDLIEDDNIIFNNVEEVQKPVKAVKMFRGVEVKSIYDICKDANIPHASIGRRINNLKDLMINGIDYFNISKNILELNAPYIIDQDHASECDYAIKLNDGRYGLVSANGNTICICTRYDKTCIYFTKSGEDILIDYYNNNIKGKYSKKSKMRMSQNKQTIKKIAPATEPKTVMVQQETIETKPTTITTTNPVMVDNTSIQSASLMVNNIINAVVASRFNIIPIPRLENGNLIYDNKEDEKIAYSYNCQVNELRTKIKTIFGEVNDSNLGYVLNMIRMEQDLK